MLQIVVIAPIGLVCIQLGQVFTTYVIALDVINRFLVVFACQECALAINDVEIADIKAIQTKSAILTITLNLDLSYLL